MITSAQPLPQVQTPFFSRTARTASASAPWLLSLAFHAVFFAASGFALHALERKTENDVKPVELEWMELSAGVEDGAEAALTPTVPSAARVRTVRLEREREVEPSASETPTDPNKTQQVETRPSVASEPATNAAKDEPAKVATAVSGGAAGALTESGVSGGSAFGQGSVPRGNPAGTGVNTNALVQGYLGSLTRWFGQSATYPMAARRARMQGTVYISFAVDSDGAVSALKLKRSSGYDALDAAALDALRALGRVPRPPALLGWTSPRFVTIPVVYRLT